MPSTQSTTSHIGITSVAQSASNKHLAGLNVTSSLARIVHHVDNNSKQQVPGPSFHCNTRGGATTHRGQNQASVRNLFTTICSAVGIKDQPEDQPEEQTSTNQTQDCSSLRKPEVAEESSRISVEFTKSILPPLSPDDLDKKCLVLDLDETLVHSSFHASTDPYVIIPVDVDDIIHHVYVCKRPGAEEFLIQMAKYYEIVVFTASLSKYADPLLDKLDPNGVIRYRLYREHCVQDEDGCVKDLSLLDRDMSQTIIVDNAPISYRFHPQNGIGCSSFIDDPSDCELESISRFLTKIHDVGDVRDHLHMWNAKY